MVVNKLMYGCGVLAYGISMNIIIWKYDIMEWVDGFGMWEMFEMN